MMDDNIPLRIAVTGITGRMGKKIIQSITTTRGKYNKKIVLGAAITRTGSDICGVDVGFIMKSNSTGIIVTDNLNIIKDDFDILIDFTTPDISIEYLKFCVDNNKNMVIGTTGFSKNYRSLIKDVSQKIGIVYSANFSIGVALMSKLLILITQVIGNVVDINIVETHHNKKIDIPSGTALMMKDIIINTLSSIVTDDSIYCETIHDRIGHKLSSSYNIPIHSIRAGNVIGEHSVLFSSIGESLQIIHKSCDRVIFSDGALFSALWLGSSKIGLFSMRDVLGL